MLATSLRPPAARPSTRTPTVWEPDPPCGLLHHQNCVIRGSVNSVRVGRQCVYGLARRSRTTTSPAAPAPVRKRKETRNESVKVASVHDTVHTTRHCTNHLSDSPIELGICSVQRFRRSSPRSAHRPPRGSLIKCPFPIRSVESGDLPVHPRRSESNHEPKRIASSSLSPLCAIEMRLLMAARLPVPNEVLHCNYSQPQGSLHLSSFSGSSPRLTVSSASTITGLAAVPKRAMRASCVSEDASPRVLGPQMNGSPSTRAP